MTPQLQSELVHAAIIGGAVILGLAVCYVGFVFFVFSKVMKKF